MKQADSRLTPPVLVHGGKSTSVLLQSAPMRCLAEQLAGTPHLWIVDASLAQHPLLPEKIAKHALMVTGGESAKSLEKAGQLAAQCLSHSLDRATTLVVVGGGTLLDLGGMTAALLLRGLPLIYVPTTLLAMVDASLGGKNGVNHGGIKNALGTVYDPKEIWIDLSWLETLSTKMMRGGVAEMIKHAFLGRSSHLPLLTSLAATPDQYALLPILDSLQVKSETLALSHAHPQLRELLNAGHTVAHGIEGATGWQVPHGDAVAQGLVLESSIAQRRGLLDAQDFQALVEICAAWRLLYTLDVDPEHIWRCMLGDKKNQKGRVYCSFLESPIGEMLRPGWRGPQPIEHSEWEAAWSRYHALLARMAPPH